MGIANMRGKVATWGLGAVIAMVFVLLVSVMAWFTHLYECFTEERWGFLIAGAIFFPIAIIHGIGVWIGIW